MADIDGTERLYFVVETKSSLLADALRTQESAKIKCAEAHFAELATTNTPPAVFMKATKLEDLF
jgi:type III restriction enzyme